MWKVLARTLKDELDAVELGPEDAPRRVVGDNDTLIRFSAEVPVEMKKIFALWKRNERERERLAVEVDALNARWTKLSIAERNAAYRTQNAFIIAARAELLWQGMWWHVVRHQFPDLSTYAVELCRHGQLVLVGEPER